MYQLAPFRASRCTDAPLAPTRDELLAWSEDAAAVIKRTEREWRPASKSTARGESTSITMIGGVPTIGMARSYGGLLDSEGLSALVQRPVDGLLGMDVTAMHDLLFDVPAARIFRTTISF